MDSPDVALVDLRINKSVDLIKGHTMGNFAAKFVGDHTVVTGGEDSLILFTDLRYP
jgi:hypothetical protein